MSVLVFDFETASHCNLKVAGAWAYAEHITTEVLCLAYGPAGGPFTVWRPGQSTNYLMALVRHPDTVWVAHNAAFEKAIWRSIMVPQFGFPDIPDERWGDTMATCAMKALPQGLDQLGAFVGPLIGLTFDKDKEGRKLTLALSKVDKKGRLVVRTPFMMARISQYCAADTAMEGQVLKRLGHLPTAEREIWMLDQKINQRGLLLDLPFIQQAKLVADRAMIPLAKEFRSLTGCSWTERDQLMAWLGKQGVHLGDLKKDTVDDILGFDPEDEEEFAEPEPTEAETMALPDHVRRALVIRRQANASSLKKLGRMEACVCMDGRVRGTLAYHGTLPGRWAGRLFQPQNFPRGTLMLDGKAPDPDLVVAAIMTGDADYVSATIGPPLETVVSALRHAIVAAEGCVLGAGDYAGIQARVVLALSGQHDKSALMASGADVYCDMAQEIYGRPIDKVKDPEERHTGKNAVLGLGFQMGWLKFQLKYARKKDEAFCRMVVEAYRRRWAPMVPKLWYALEEAAVRTVWTRNPHEAYGVRYAMNDVWLTARLPSGRLLWYPFPEKVRKAMPWDKLDIRPGFTFQAMKMGQWRTIWAFGGQLTENIVMGIERDIMTGGMLRLEAAGYPLVLQVHDDAMAEIPVAKWNKDEYVQIMCDVEPWVHELKIPIAVEPWSGGRYRK